MTPSSMSSVSVALCTHNGSSYIEVQLLSILAQTQLPDEIIISDDASSDSTVDIARSVLSQWSIKNPEHVLQFTVLVNAAKLGVTQNFEKAIRHCTGDLVVLCDQDDIWRPDRIETARTIMERSPSLDLLFSDARLVDQIGSPTDANLLDALEVGTKDRNTINSGDAFSVLIRRNIVTGATVMFRRSLLTSALPFPPRWIHDEWLAIIAASVGTVKLVDKPLIDYRQHATNQIGVSTPTIGRKVRRVLQHRGERNELLAQKFASLADRLASLPNSVPSTVLARAQIKARVERTRASLPRCRIARLRAIFLLVKRGWYREYCSRGNMDILRDLLQPHR